jgi:hypothetical protein
MTAAGWSYNVGVATPAPQARRDPQSRRQPKPHIYDLEATGIIVIAVLIFILTLVRYWHHIPWGVR